MQIRTYWNLLAQKKTLPALGKLAAALLLAFVLGQIPLDSAEFYAYDLLLRHKLRHQGSQKVVIVKMDRASIEQLRQEPRLNDYNLLLQQLHRLQPKAVLFLPDLKRLGGSSSEKAAFARSAARLSNFIVSVEDVPLAGAEDKFKLPPPLDLVNVQPGILSKDSRNFARDNVSRRALVHYEGQYFAQAQIAQLLRPMSDPTSYQGAFEFKGSTQVFVNLHPRGSFPSHSFIDVIDGYITADQIRDKIVVIGQDAQSEADNYLMTPFLRDVTAMSKAEYNANIIDGLIQNNSLRQISALSRWWIGFIVIWLSIYITLKLRPVRGIISLLALASCYIALAYFLIHFAWWLPVAGPLFAIFAGYYLLIPFRLVQENKRSWEYQQKNRMMLQVEELKNNFISMMSHDLKTPLARIQGMAEMALNSSSELAPDQQEALHSIRHSSEELSRFVSSILNFGRIESEGVNLRLEPKDLNNLIEEVVKRYRPVAKERNIDLCTELEPLFSIPMDTDLMRQVLQNLIENAIKYSPNDSRVLIRSEEVDAQVRVHISDEGQGIPREEKEKIFLKFYRSKNAKSSPIKGTGLGLYLSKYFVELHRGRLEVESIESKGSTFSLSLPTQ